MMEWKDVEADEFDEECASCRARARLAQALVARNPQTADEIAAVVGAVVFELPLVDVMGLLHATMRDAVPERERRRGRRRAAAH